jgi:hypothetical protein
VAELPAAFVEALAAQRDSLNARFALRLRGGSRIDAETFLRHLEQSVAPLIGQIHAVQPDRSRAVVAALYDVSLDLFAASLLGPDAKMPWVKRVWAELFPAAAGLLARQPQQVAGSLCNAMFQISTQAGSRPQRWIQRMQQVVPHCTSLGELLEAGQVAAWQAGMVQYRAAALTAAGQLRAPLAALALGLPESTSAAEMTMRLNRLRDHAWLTVEAAGSAEAGQAIECVATVGAFSGFGGVFFRPPLVSSDKNRLLVSDGRSQWELLADAYGAWFRRAGGAPAKRSKAPTHDNVSVDRHGTIRWGEQSLALAQLANPSSFAVSGPTLALTIPTSHHVFLFSNMGSPA